MSERTQSRQGEYARQISSQIAHIVERQLSGDYSETLTRFSYINGAGDFFRMIKSPHYRGYTKELTLIDRIIPKVRSQCGGCIGVIDLGPGDGKKGARVLSRLEGIASQYAAMDISGRMLGCARQNQRRFSSIPRRYAVGDFSHPVTLQRMLNGDLNGTEEPESVMLLLGNTLTNETDPGGFLSTVRKVSQQKQGKNTSLILGVETLGGNIREIEMEYQNEDNYALTFRPLEMVRVPRDAGVLSIGFNEKLRRIEEWFVFSTASAIFGTIRTVEARPGDAILLSVTYKPTLQEVMGCIERSGWMVELAEFEGEQMMAVISSR